MKERLKKAPVLLWGAGEGGLSSRVPGCGGDGGGVEARKSIRAVEEVG